LPQCHRCNRPYLCGHPGPCWICGGEKYFHSLNVQKICDGSHLISNIKAKWPGSVHDSMIFQASSLVQRFAQDKRMFFQCLKGLRVTPDLACDIVIACSVLQNIATYVEGGAM
ncbi:hypothetical protein L3Q82_015894, partial [Scortum barcoo]